MPNFLEMARFRKMYKRCKSSFQDPELQTLQIAFFPNPKKKLEEKEKKKKKRETRNVHLFQGDVKFPLKQALRVQSLRLPHPRTPKRSPLDRWSAISYIDIMSLHRHRDGFMTWINRLHGVHAPPSPASEKTPPLTPPKLLPSTSWTSLRNEDNLR